MIIYGVTSREWEVAMMVYKDATNAEIAKALHITIHTVQNHKRSIRYKLFLGTGGDIKRAVAQYLERLLSQRNVGGGK